MFQKYSFVSVERDNDDDKMMGKISSSWKMWEHSDGMECANDSDLLLKNLVCCLEWYIAVA